MNPHSANAEETGPAKSLREVLTVVRRDSPKVDLTTIRQSFEKIGGHRWKNFPERILHGGTDSSINY